MKKFLIAALFLSFMTSVSAQTWTTDNSIKSLALTGGTATLPSANTIMLSETVLLAAQTLTLPTPTTNSVMLRLMNGSFQITALTFSSAVAGWTQGSVLPAFGELDLRWDTTNGWHVGRVMGALTTDANQATIAGGSNNTVSGGQAFIGGGGSNTASGYRSFVLGGASNTAGGSYTMLLGGASSSFTGAYSIGGGNGALDRGLSSETWTPAFFAAAGDMQHRFILLHGTAAGGATVELTADGNAANSLNVLQVPSRGVFALDITIVATDETDDTKRFVWRQPLGLASKYAAASSMNYTDIGTVISGGTATGFTVALIGDTTAGKVAFNVTFPTGTDTWRAVAWISSTEVQ